MSEVGLTGSEARSREDQSLTGQDRVGLGSRQQAQQGRGKQSLSSARFLSAATIYRQGIS